MYIFSKKFKRILVKTIKYQMIYCCIFFMICLFFCPKDWGQNFIQNDVECSGKLEFSSAQSDVECPVNQICIGCHPYSTENEKSKVCVKKAYKSPIRAGILFAYAYPYGKKKSSGKKSGGHGYIPPSVRITDGVIVNSKGDEDIKYAIFDNSFFNHVKVVYQFFDCSGNDSWIGFIMNSLEVCNCKFTGNFNLDRNKINEIHKRNTFIEYAQIQEKIRQHNLPNN